MSKSSEAVKEWRKNTKAKMIVCMGSKCQICGYSKSSNALEFHHITPKEKKFSLSSIRGNPTNWENIKQELAKCILLCSNCHKEVHENLTTLPETYQKFDEQLLKQEENKHLIKQAEQTFCPVCGKQKQNEYITCSKQCSAKRANSFDWSKYDIVDMIENKKMPKTQIAKIIGCSDVAVTKKYKKLKSFL